MGMYATLMLDKVSFFFSIGDKGAIALADGLMRPHRMKVGSCTKCPGQVTLLRRRCGGVAIKLETRELQR